ncbi:MAG: hypothetical protein ACRD27_09870 [Terracidiphilus sp.]
MRKLAVCLCLSFLVPAFARPAHAREASRSSDASNRAETAKAPAAPEHFYHLDFVLEQFDASGKPVNSRSFTTTVGTAGSGSGAVTVGSKIPVATGFNGQGTGPTQFQFIDVGVKITVHDVLEVGSRLSFRVDAGMSNVAESSDLGRIKEPIITNNDWNGSAVIPIGKRTVVFKSDSLDNKGSMELTVTATEE